MPFGDLLRSSQRRNSSRNTLPPQINTQQVQPPKEVRRVIGYHNVIHLDPENDFDLPEDPPGYDATVFSRRKTRSAPDEGTNRDEAIPGYSCSVSMETSAEVHYEQLNPFEPLKKQQWSQVYVVLSGTLLRLHALKKPSANLLTMSNDRSQAGRLLKAYSMQHAEVGIAADEPKQQLVAKSPYIAMLPEAKIERLKIAEPHLFDVVKRYFVRIRVEGEQLLFRLGSSEDRSRWIDKLCAAVDIAPPIEDRTEPKYHTLPRRRRRRPPPEGTNENTATAGPSTVPGTNGLGMDLQTGFPILAPVGEGEALQRVTTAADPDSTGDIDESLAFAGAELSEPAPAPERPSRPSLDIRRIFSRRTATNTSNADELASPASPTRTSTQVESPVQAAPPVAKINTKVPARIYPDGFIKWQPQFFIDSAQQIRYRRHCMPSLLYNSKRANDIVVHQGTRWKIDWDNSRLVPWPEAPPTYQPPKVSAPQVPKNVVQEVDVPSAHVPVNGTATTSLSDAGASTAETAATSVTTASQVADSATASIHAGDGNIEGWNWSSSRGKLTAPPSEHPALVETTEQEEVQENQELPNTPRTADVSNTPQSTPHTLRRTGHLNLRTLQTESAPHTPGNNVSGTAPGATSSSPKLARRSDRRSFQFFSKSTRSDLAPQDGSANSDRHQTPSAQKPRSSFNMVRPFSGRNSVDINRAEAESMLNGTASPSDAQSPTQSRSKRFSLTMKSTFSGRTSMDNNRPELPSSQATNTTHSLHEPRTPPSSYRRRLSTTLLQPFSGRTSLDTSRAEVVTGENQSGEDTVTSTATQSPTLSRGHPPSTTLRRPFSSRPSMETPRSVIPTEHLDAASPPSSRRSERSAHRLSFDFWRGKDAVMSSDNPAMITSSPARRPERMSLQVTRPQMSDIVPQNVPMAPASTSRMSSWKQRFRKLSNKPPPPPVVQILPEKNVDVFAPHSSYGSAWQSGRVSVVVE